jgi:predicted  nucleic acid-binding Zn-ribbon protein
MADIKFKTNKGDITVAQLIEKLKPSIKAELEEFKKTASFKLPKDTDGKKNPAEDAEDKSADLSEKEDELTIEKLNEEIMTIHSVLEKYEALIDDFKNDMAESGPSVQIDRLNQEMACVWEHLEFPDLAEK